uniref:CSON006686 protein n=1 Tax=Culicoides sonorensis TaxID=179676 RepID=A0A336MVR4_CULSO
MIHKSSVSFNIILILLLFHHPVFLVFADAVDVDNEKYTYLKLDSGQELAINSFNIPLGLGYRIFAPYNHKIQLNCSYIKRDDDDDEFLYVQTDYTRDNSGGQSIFVSSNFTKTSLFNQIKIGLRYLGNVNKYKGNDTLRGEFQCKVAVIKESRCRCGWGRQGRIVNGNETEVNEFPSIVAFIHTPSNYTFCGGTIIHHRYILSAAHCFQAIVYQNRFEVTIKIGTHNYHNDSSSAYTQTHQLEKIIIHPEYETTEQDNDIALVRVSRDIIFSRGSGPACLPFKFIETTFYDESVQMVGWGTISWGGTLSHVLRKVMVNVMDTDECDKKIVWVNEKKLCTYAPEKDACQSDSGGPVYYMENSRYYVVGIISFGIKCATHTPGVNTRVTNYLDWITATIKDDSFCDVQ